MNRADVSLFKDEKLLLEMHPSKRAVLYYLLQRGGRLVMIALMVYLIYGVAMQVLATFTGRYFSLYGFLLHNVFLMVLLILLFFIAFYIAGRWFANNCVSYIFTTHRCIWSTRFISLNQRIIPFSRVVDVRMHCSALQRLIGIAMVEIDEQSVNYASMSAATRNTQAGRTMLYGLTLQQSQRAVQIASEQMGQR